MPNNDKIVVLSSEAYPSNSDKSKAKREGQAEAVSRPKPKAVAMAKRVKKPLLKRFSDAFLDGGTGADVITYVVHDVIIPAAKSTFADLVEGAIDMVLFGEEGGRGRRRASRVGNRSYIPYSDIYNGGASRRGERAPVRQLHNVERAVPIINRQGVESIVLGSRGEGERVLGEMFELSTEYGMVSLADLYDLVGLSSDFTDQKWGWFDLQNCPCSVVRVREGFALDLPRPVIIE